MSTLALSLILLSAIIHATWNMVFKRTGGGKAFILAYSCMQTLIYAPLVIFIWLSLPDGTRALSPLQWGFIVGTGLIHFGYFVLLDKAYRVGDLSVVYPVARSTGPLLCIVGAVLLFAERPTIYALMGSVLIGSGAVALASGASQDPNKPKGVSVGFALLTGCFIAAYTMWDRYAVRELGINVFLFDWLGGLMRLMCMLPVFWAYRREAVVKSRMHWKAMLFIAIVSPLSYILALFALKLAPLSYIAPARETSVIFGALYGTLLLGEGQTAKRVTCAVVMFGGLLLLALN
jgi:drug/metabolite transporter (DMT)-like permease